MAVSSVSYPMLLDLSRDECKRLLRHLELTAYESVVSAFRAQGDLNQEKRELLKQLQHLFSISTERHRAEVRRAVNDETLTTIADSMSGPDVSSEWLVDGNRLVPLMPRLVPQTAFTITANQMANQQAEKNMALPMPSQTGVKERMSNHAAHSLNTTPVTTKISRPTSPGEVVILPGGRSIHIKGTLAQETEEEPQTRRRRRDSSAESIMVSRVSVPGGLPTPTMARAPSHASIPSSAVSMPPAPMRITISKSPQKVQPQATSQPQKVILVSSANQGIPRASLPKSVSAAVSVHTSGTTSTITLPKPSIIMPSTTHTASSNLNNIITVAASSSTQTIYTPQTSVAASASSYLANTLTSVKPRTKQFTPVRGRTPQQIQGLGGGPVIQGPVTTLPHVPHTPISSIQMRPSSKPAIHIKQEGSMKIITQGTPGAAGKLLPKPATSGVVVVTTVAASISGSLAVTTKATGASSLAGKVISVGPHGSKVIAGSIARTSGANVVTVNPKTLHLASGRILTGGTGGVTSGKVLSTTKPNVIVVQKSQARRTIATTGTTATQVIRTPVGAGGASFEKELVSYLQKQGTQGSQVRVAEKQLRKVEVGPKGQQRTVQQIQVPRTKVEGDGGKSSLLAELIQAVGILPDGSTPQAAEGTSSGNQWVEMDTSHRITEQLPQEVTDASAVQMLLNLQSSAAKQKTQHVLQQAAATATTTVRPGSLELRQVTRPTAAEPGESALRRELYHTPTVRKTQMPSEMRKTSEGNVIELQLGTPTNLSQLNLSSRDMLREIDTPQGVVYQLVKGAIPEIDLTNDDEDEPVKSQDTHDEGLLELAPPSNIGVVGSVPTTVEVMNSPSTASAETVNLPTQPKQLQQPVVSEQDIFSSALAEAQIDLNSYKYIEDQPAKVIVQPVTTAVTEQSVPEAALPLQSAAEVGLMSILTQAAEMRQGLPVSEPTSEPKERVSTPEAVITGQTEREVSVAEDQIPSSFIAVPEDIVEGTSAGIQVSSHPVHSQNVMLVTGSKSTSLLSQSAAHDDMQLPMSSSSVEVLSTPSETSQEGALMDSTGSEIMDDPAMRASKRKRKPPTPLEESPTPGSVSGWARAAIGLLQKVCRFRGANKDKNAHSASLWFLKPVDMKEVPDYYDIIKQPMDFMTVRRKLESGQYCGWEDFNDDMELIKSNAFEYNPEGHIVRQDAEEVFTFYTQEYAKTLEKWQKGGVASPQGKKLKLDRSPSRH